MNPICERCSQNNPISCQSLSHLLPAMFMLLSVNWTIPSVFKVCIPQPGGGRPKLFHHPTALILFFFTQLNISKSSKLAASISLLFSSSVILCDFFPLLPLKWNYSLRLQPEGSCLFFSGISCFWSTQSRSVFPCLSWCKHIALFCFDTLQILSLPSFDISHSLGSVAEGAGPRPGSPLLAVSGRCALPPLHILLMSLLFFHITAFLSTISTPSLLMIFSSTFKTDVIYYQSWISAKGSPYVI